MHHHILIPLDGSKFSETILPHAVAFAHATESALMLFQVLEPLCEPIYGAPGISEKQQEEQMARMRDAQLASIHDYLMNIARPLQSQGLEIHTRVIEGNDPAAQIVLQAEQDPCPLLIAMTTHGRSGVLRWLFGSVTAEVVQAAPTPLLLLRLHENSGPYSTVNAKAVLYQTVIVPLDGSSFAEQAHMLASAVNATLLLVSIVPPPNAIAIQRDKEAISLMRTLLQTEMEKRTRYLE